ncbi:MAG: DUF2207 domain-containing protein [Acidimicrobiales bacterium]
MLRGVKVWAHLAVALSIVAVVVLALAGVIGQPNRPEKIERLQVVASGAGDSGLRVTEVIDQDFGSADRHGPQLVIPNDFGAPVEVTASSDDAPDDVHVLPDNDCGTSISGATCIRVGDPDVTVTGQHRYRISYVLPAARYAGPDFDWDAVGAESDIPIEDVTVQFDGIELASPQCSKGATGTDGGCAFEKGAPLRLAVDRLGKREGITVSGEVTAWRAGQGVEPRPLPSRRNDDPTPAVIAALVLATATAAATFLWARRTGGNEVVGVGAAEAAHGAGSALGPTEVRRVSDAELGEMSTIEFAPPKGITPWQGAVAVTEVLDDDTVTAWFSGAVADDVLAIERHGDAPRLTYGPKADQADAVTAGVLHTMFANRQVVDLDSYDPAFAKAWTKVKELQQDWVNASGWWRTRPPQTGRGKPGGCASVAVLILGVVAAVVLAGLILGALGVIGGVVSLVVVAIGLPWLVARVAYAPLLPGRTANGSAYALQTESFRRFLVESEGQYVEWAWKNGLLRQYSAWAVALDAADAWEAAMERAGVPRQEIDATSPLLVHTMAHSFASSRVDPTTTSSSSSGGFSSGGGFSGSVGGGGGGGSHGSW